VRVEIKELTAKARRSFAETGYLNVWEGSVRSGKTVVSLMAWLRYAMLSPESHFLMSGSTLGTLYANAIGGDYGALSLLGARASYGSDRDGNRILALRPRPSPAEPKICYCVGAHDDSSYKRIRGRTIGGWYADEVSLCPRSFVEEALRRSIVSKDRKNFWTLNPENPSDWIYSGFLDKYLAAGLDGFRLWHFTLDDNLAISGERKAELKSQYSGVFYRRYILGERCAAEGAVYDTFGPECLYGDGERPYQLELRATRCIACDYGTRNPSVFLSVWDDGQTVWVDDEYRWDSASDEARRRGRAQKTDGEYADDMAAFMGQDRCEIVVDPSAASFAAELRARLFFVRLADNDVLNGVRALSNLFAKRMVRVHRDRCAGLARELESYAWDEKAAQRGEERPVKQMDHGPDALRYYAYTKLPSWRTGVAKRRGESEEGGEE
jgi:PBSX family phage terminase large subunit